MKLRFGSLFLAILAHSAGAFVIPSSTMAGFPQPPQSCLSPTGHVCTKLYSISEDNRLEVEKAKNNVIRHFDTEMGVWLLYAAGFLPLIHVTGNVYDEASDPSGLGMSYFLFFLKMLVACSASATIEDILLFIRSPKAFIGREWENYSAFGPLRFLGLTTWLSPALVLYHFHVLDGTSFELIVWAYVCLWWFPFISFHIFLLTVLLNVDILNFDEFEDIVDDLKS